MFNFFFRFPGGRPDVTFTLNEDQVSGANDIPKQHKFILTGVVGQSLSILTETPAAGEGKIGTGYSGINLYMRPAIERWRYNIVTSSLIGCVHTQNDPWILQFLCLCFFNLLYFSCLFFYMYISVSSLVTWTMEWPVQISSIPCSNSNFFFKFKSVYCHTNHVHTRNTKKGIVSGHSISTYQALR